MREESPLAKTFPFPSHAGGADFHNGHKTAGLCGIWFSSHWLLSSAEFNAFKSLLEYSTQLFTMFASDGAVHSLTVAQRGLAVSNENRGGDKDHVLEHRSDAMES